MSLRSGPLGRKQRGVNHLVTGTDGARQVRAFDDTRCYVTRRDATRRDDDGPAMGGIAGGNSISADSSAACGADRRAFRH